MAIFKKIFYYFSATARRQRKHLKELRAFATVFSEMEQKEKQGLLHWHPRNRQLLLEESLALAMLSKGAKKWKCFLQNILLWQCYNLAQEQAEADRIKAETQAVREAKRNNPSVILTESDINRIRQNARANMTERPAPRIDSFDIFIIRAIAQSATQASEATGELLAIGHYDINGNMDLALWDDVKHNLRKEE